jgi:hypothetical protein
LQILKNPKSEYRNPKDIQNSNIQNQRISPSPLLGEGEGEMIRFPLPYIPFLQGRGDFEWVLFPKLVFGTFGFVSNFVFRASNLEFPVLT